MIWLQPLNLVDIHWNEKCKILVEATLGPNDCQQHRHSCCSQEVSCQRLNILLKKDCFDNSLQEWAKWKNGKSNQLIFKECRMLKTCLTLTISRLCIENLKMNSSIPTLLLSNQSLTLKVRVWVVTRLKLLVKAFCFP